MRSTRARPRPEATIGVVAAFVWAALTTCDARGELLYFKKGGEIQAPATIDGNRVLINLPEASLEFERSDFRKLVSGFNPEAEARERLDKARSSGEAALDVAIWWAIENGLVDQVIPVLRERHRNDRGHASTARMVTVLDRLAAASVDPEIDLFRKALGVPMSATRGPHVLLLHQRTEEEAGVRLSLLEKVLTGYYLFFAAQGIDLKPPQKRLVAAWFDRQQDYLAFLRSQDAAAFSTTKGYFHPTWNAVVLLDGRESERQSDGREAAAARRSELRQFRDTVGRLPARARLRVTLTGEASRTLGKDEALSLAGRLEREIQREELLLDLERRAIDEGTAAHEMIHLLAANSGLLPRYDAFPRWLQEGLAMQFELIRGGRWAGIGRAHDLRLPDWRKIEPRPALDPLVRDIGYSRGYQRDIYAKAWALVYFLRVSHPAEFLTFLDLLRGHDAALAELAPSDRYATAFRRAFSSDLEPIEREWHHFMATVHTPLELHAPDRRDDASPPPKPRPAARPSRRPPA